MYGNTHREWFRVSDGSVIVLQTDKRSIVIINININVQTYTAKTVFSLPFSSLNKKILCYDMYIVYLRRWRFALLLLLFGFPSGIRRRRKKHFREGRCASIHMVNNVVFISKHNGVNKKKKKKVPFSKITTRKVDGIRFAKCFSCVKSRSSDSPVSRHTRNRCCGWNVLVSVDRNVRNFVRSIKTIVKPASPTDIEKIRLRYSF